MKHKIFPFLLILVLAFILFLLVVNLLFKPVENREVKWFGENELLVAKQSATSIEHLVSKLEADLRFVASLEEVQNLDPKLCPKRLEELYARIHPLGSSVSRMDEQGIIRFTYPQKFAQNRSVADQPHVQYTLKTHKEIISDPIMSVQGFRAIILHIPVFNSDSVYKGSVAVLIPFELIPKLFVERIKLTAGSYAWLISESGIILYHPTIEAGSSAWDVISNADKGLKEIVNEALSGKEGTGIYTFSGVKKLAAFTSISLPGKKWVLGVASPYRDVIRNLVVVKRRIQIVSGIALLGILFLLVLYRQTYLKKELIGFQLEQVKELNQLYCDMIENVDYGVFIVDSKLKLLSANNHFTKIFDIKEPNGKYLFNVLPFLREYNYEHLYNDVFSKGAQHFESNWFIYDAVEKFLEIKLIPLFNAEGKIERVLTLVKDVSEEKRLERELLKKSRDLERTNRILHELAITDELTGIYNYRYFKDTVSNLFRWAKEKGKRFSLLVMDLDGFKGVNDTLGHLEGDAILANISEEIKKVVPPPGSLARYGGDEFVAILPELESSEALEIAERIRMTVETTFTASRTKASPVTVSIGVSTFNPSMKDVDELIRQADRALYKAKESGRNKVVFAESTQK